MKKKKNLINLKFYKKTLIILFSIILILSIYYFKLDKKWFVFFFTSIFSLIFFTINNAYNARFNEFDKNTNLLLNYSLIKFALIYFAYKYNFEIIYFLIFSNFLIILLSLKIVKNINFILNKKNSFSIKSVTNNILGTGNTTLDKLYCTNFAPLIAVNYFIIFKVASVFQYFTEVIFRKERFIITEGKSKVSIKIIIIKFFLLLSVIIFLNLIIRYSENYIKYPNYEQVQFIVSFIKILLTFNNEFSLIALCFFDK